MTAREYYHTVLQLLTTSRVVASQRIELDEQDEYVAYIKGTLNLIDGSTLFFAQYVRIERTCNNQIDRKKHRYHCQDLNGDTHRRWDNARHHPDLPSFPHHVHIGKNEDAQENGPADLRFVMGEVEKEFNTIGTRAVLRNKHRENKKEAVSDASLMNFSLVIHALF